jgi:hypothetical protein
VRPCFVVDFEMVGLGVLFVGVFNFKDSCEKMILGSECEGRKNTKSANLPRRVLKEVP